LVGFQAEGTRGRLLQEGANELKIHGKYYPVNCTVESISTLSAHADQYELIDWISDLEKEPEHLFLVHGESQASDNLRAKIKHEKGWNCIIPGYNESYEL